MILYPFENIYPIYIKEYEKQTIINNLNSSIWKLFDPFLKVIDKKDRIKNSLDNIINEYKYYNLYEFIYLSKTNNFIPLYIIYNSNNIDNNYLTTIINLLYFNNRINIIKGWFDTNNNLICYFDNKSAINFYNFFLY